MKFCFQVFFVSVIIFTSLNLFAQKAKYLGLNATLETSSSNFRPSAGIIYEQRFTKRSGIETGIYYRNYIQNLVVIFNTPTSSDVANIRLSERHLSIPALYKFYTRLVNISAGPSFEFYLGWKEKSDNQTIKTVDYSNNSAFNIGLMAKISRSIKLNERFNLEPEVRFNPIITNDRAYIGLGLAAKYKL